MQLEKQKGWTAAAETCSCVYRVHCGKDAALQFLLQVAEGLCLCVQLKTEA